MVFNEIDYLFAYVISGLMIGFVGGMVGLVMGVVRFPIVFSMEHTAGIAAGTNLGISTLASITAAIKHSRQNNIDFQVFRIMAVTGASGALSAPLTGHIPITWVLKI